MLKRYARIIIVGLLCGVLSSTSIHAVDENISAQSGQTYTTTLKKYVELLGVGAAFICAYIVYKMSATKKAEEIDFSDFDEVSDKKGHEAQV